MRKWYAPLSDNTSRGALIIAAVFFLVGIICLAQNTRSAWHGPVYLPYSPAVAAAPISSATILSFMQSANAATNQHGHFNAAGGWYCASNASFPPLFIPSGCNLVAVINFPHAAQYYNITVTGCLQNSFANGIDEGFIGVLIDQFALNQESSTTYFGQYTIQGTVPPLTPTCTPNQTVTWTAPILSGNHLFALFIVPGGNNPVEIETVSITATTGTVKVEPAGDRDAYHTPLSSYNYWNMPIGGNAVWSLSTDADTQTLTTGSVGVVNAGQWSTPWYEGRLTDPVQLFLPSPDPIAPNLQTFALHMPLGMTVSPPGAGGDNTIVVLDGNNLRYIYGGNYGCAVTAPSSAKPGSVGCVSASILDQCNPNMTMGYGQSNQTGLIRVQELQSGVIKHTLGYAIATQMLAPPASNFSGVQFPIYSADYCAHTCYTGNVPPGSTIGIPSTVNLNSLGLTKSGLGVAQALQNFGALMTASGGQPSQNVIFFSEQAAEGMSELDDVRNDLPIIIPQLRVLRNNTPTTIKGGGSPIVPLLPGVSVCQGVQ